MIYDGRTQKEDVFFALGKLGGEAHCQAIYSELKDTWEQKYHYNLNERDAAGIRWHHSIQGRLGSLQYDGLVENINI